MGRSLCTERCHENGGCSLVVSVLCPQVLGEAKTFLGAGG